MDNFVTKVPCPRVLKLPEKETKLAVITFFKRNCLPHPNVKVLNVKELISTNRPCGYVLYCEHKFQPEDKLLEEGLVLGTEKLVHQIIEEQKTKCMINISDYTIEFFDENNFQASIYLHCQCSKPTFCIIDKINKLII